MLYLGALSRKAPFLFPGLTVITFGIFYLSYILKLETSDADLLHAKPGKNLSSSISKLILNLQGFDRDKHYPDNRLVPGKVRI